jgi:hypothetical protein
MEEGSDQVMASISLDYSLVSGWYFNASMLYNSTGAAEPNFSILGATNSNIDVRSLSPYRYSTFVQTLYPISPLLSVGVSAMTFPSTGATLFNPFITYSVKQNLDLDLVTQTFFDQRANGHFGLSSSASFLRLKWSF